MIDFDEKLIVLDTETTNSLDDPLCYDIGFAVVDVLGNVYETHSYVVADIYLDKELMSYAYFADKIPQYEQELKEGKRKLRRLSTIHFILRDVMMQYGITKVVAHNARFDYISTNVTQRYITSSKYRYFFPYGTEIIDTLKMARSTFGKDEDYKRFCEENDYLTSYGSPRFTAEILHRFLADDADFEEAHTGLEDVMIEKDILAECLKRNSECEGRLW